MGIEIVHLALLMKKRIVIRIYLILMVSYGWQLHIVLKIMQLGK
jgi:hypothetical protein